MKIETFTEAASELFMDHGLIRRIIILNIKKRAKLCIEHNSGHFEHLLKLKNYKNEELISFTFITSLDFDFATK